MKVWIKIGIPITVYLAVLIYAVTISKLSIILVLGLPPIMVWTYKVLMEI